MLKTQWKKMAFVFVFKYCGHLIQVTVSSLLYTSDVFVCCKLTIPKPQWTLNHMLFQLHFFSLLVIHAFPPQTRVESFCNSFLKF